MMKYTISQFLSLAINVVRTKFVFSNARIIRFPIDVRGKQSISIQKGFTTGVGCRLETYSTQRNHKTLIIGKDVQINDYVHITAMECVHIGDNVLIASKVYISDCSHGSYAGDESDSHPDSRPIDRPLYAKAVQIGDNVWIGEMVSILPGVNIGRGTIVGANSVVTKDLPPYVIAVGVPAVPVKRFNFEHKRWDKI